MLNENYERIFSKVITLKDDLIIFSNHDRANLISLRRYLVLNYFNKASEEITVSFQRNNYPRLNEVIVRRNDRMLVTERKTNKILKFDFDDFQDFIANNPFVVNYKLIDKRTKDFATTELSNKFQKNVVSPNVVVDSETNTQECNITVDHIDHYINSLKISLRKLNDSDFLSVLNSAVALPYWCSDNKFSSIFKDELTRRHNSSSGNS